MDVIYDIKRFIYESIDKMRKNAERIILNKEGCIMRDLNSMVFRKVTKENPIGINVKHSKNQLLYHYTKIESLPGIVGNNTLWITQSGFLNDKSEITNISSIIDAVIVYLIKHREEYKEVYLDYVLLDIIVDVLRGIGEVYKTGMLINDADAFILSFTENKNNLNLYMNYAGEDGVSIGFKNNIDEMFFSENLNKYHIIKYKGRVIYDIEEQINILLEDINILFFEMSVEILEKGITTIDNKIYDDIMKDVEAILYVKIINYAFFFKNYHFKHEDEYRVVFLLDKKYTKKLVKYRVREGVIIPYIELKYQKSSINEIRISPQNKKELSQKSIEFYLNGNEYKDIRVIKSEIPFR